MLLYLHTSIMIDQTSRMQRELDGRMVSVQEHLDRTDDFTMTV